MLRGLKGVGERLHIWRVLLGYVTAQNSVSHYRESLWAEVMIFPLWWLVMIFCGTTTDVQKKNTVDVYEIRRKWMKNSVYKTDSLSP